MSSSVPGIPERLTATLAEILVLNEEDIHPSSKLVDDLDADSITFLELTYRLRKDFGLEVPEAKVDEETLRLPLLEGIDRLEQRLGGTTLFEFMKLEAQRDEDQDEATRERTLALLRESVSAPGFAESLTAALGEGAEARGAARAAALFVQQAAKVPALAAALDELLLEHPSLAPVLAQLREQGAAEIAHGGLLPGESLLSLWRDLTGAERARERLAEIKIRQLSNLMATTVPQGYDPEASIASLQLRDLFRFITVESYVRYVLHLSAAQDKIGEMGGAAAMNAELAAWLRAKQQPGS